MMETLTLIERLESAKVGSRELDAEIEAVLTGWYASHLFREGGTRRSYGLGTLFKTTEGAIFSEDTRTARHYTTSIDDALRWVVPEDQRLEIMWMALQSWATGDKTTERLALLLCEISVQAREAADG